jgi:zinc/manganese transport system ATP-binding protein
VTTAAAAAGGVVTVRDLRVVLSGRAVLGGIDLDVAAGDFVGLIGANGAGKTTLLRALLGVVTVTSGTIRRPPRAADVGGVGYLPQKTVLDPDAPLRARDVVALGLDGGRLGLPLRRRRTLALVDETLERVGATAFADRRIGELSGGQQQRVLLAHALISQPSLLLLDEPLANLDPASAADIVALLHTVRRDHGVGIVLTAHDINLLLPVLDRVVYLADGRAVTGTPADVIREDVLSRLYGRPIRVIDADGRLVVLADDRTAVPAGPVRR